VGGSLSAKPIKMSVQLELGIFFGSSLFCVANTFELPISTICYPNVEYSQADFLMDTNACT